MTWQRTALILVIVCVVAFFLVDRSGGMSAGWRRDEGQRIAESYFWRLLVRRDFSNPDWFLQATIRSHPPVNKFFFGAAIRLQGIQPPRDLALARRYDAGFPSDAMPADFEKEYFPMLRPARRAALVCNVGTVALLFWLVWRFTGLWAALLSSIAFWRHYLFASLLISARSDAVESFLSLAALLLAAVSLRARRGVPLVASAAAAGALAAFAFQTRLNGGIALIGVLVVWLANLERALIRDTALRIGIAIVTFVVLSVAIYPFYWSVPLPAEGVPAGDLLHRSLIPRIGHRFAEEVGDLQTLLDHVSPEWHLDRLSERMQFTFHTIVSGSSGLFVVLGWLFFIVVAARRKLARESLSLSLGAAAMVAVFSVWVPLAWTPYVLIVLPAAFIVAAIGWSAAVDVARSYFRTPKAEPAGGASPKRDARSPIAVVLAP